MFPLLVASLAFFRWEGESWRSIGRGAACVLTVALLLPAGWWARNYRLYGEVTPVTAFMREFEHTKKAQELIGRRGFTADPWSGEMIAAEDMSRGQYMGLLANWTFRSFWAAFTPPGRAAELGIPFFLPPVYYLVAGLLLIPPFGGLLKLHFRRKELLTSAQCHMVRLSFLLLFLVLASFIAFTWVFFQAQGRYLYPALLPISMLWAVGLRALVPEMHRDSASIAALCILLLLSIGFVLAGVLPAYSPQA